MPPSTTISMSEANHIEDYDNVLTNLWHNEIGYPINIVMRQHCTKEGMESFLNAQRNTFIA